jgi:DNA polymerase/3'-5' exonuclease PolX
MDKHKIINEFKKLQQQIMFDIDNTTGLIKLKNQYRLKSITVTVKALEKYPKNKITNKDLPDIFKIKGIGEGTIKRIKEILETGKLSEIKITESDKQYLKMIEELEEIYGIGRITAYKLFKEYKITSIDELIDKINKKEIVVPENIMKGIKYVRQLDTKIPRKEIDEINEFLLDVMYEIDIRLFGTTCGSYRRQKDTSGDVDFIIIHHDYKTDKDLTKNNEINYLDIVVQKLIEKKFIIDSLTKTDVKTKYMGIFKWKNSKPRRIDIRIFPTESYYSAILYFTGSKDFNRQMRLNAIAHNYILNEYGLYNEKGKMFKIETEKDIFDLLGMEYITPDKR